MKMQEVEFEVGADLEGKTLAASLRAQVDELSWNQARALCRRGKVTLNGSRESNDAKRLVAGDRVVINPEAKRLRSGALPEAEIVYVDADIVVANKPSGLLSLPVHENEVDHFLARVVETVSDKRTRGTMSLVHRLDRDTSGLMVLARHRNATHSLKEQFYDRSIGRTYQALVYHHARSQTHRSHFVEDRGDGIRGSWEKMKRRKHGSKPPKRAKLAVTHVELLEKYARASFVECKLETGRQHQIRIHLSEAGTPLIGERVYIREHHGDKIPASRHMLHAGGLRFLHPRNKEVMHFEQDPPKDFASLYRKLRKKK